MTYNMINEYLILSFYIMWGILVFTTVCFLISGIDDFIFDLVYWSYMAWRKWALKRTSELVYEKWIHLPQQRIAVMIPCWHEAGVIEVMLKYNSYAIDYENYDLFVGVYPNDPTTVAAVEEVAKTFSRIKCVIGGKPGPTNKASNLNAIFAYIMDYEQKNNIKYDIFVLHDSEDIIHNLSFRLYNYLIPKNAMVQLPVFPLPVELAEFTHWIYAAEFSEAHTKDMVVREKIGGLVPSAGVSTGFSREAMEYLKSIRNGVPFSTNSLTEDYNTALQIHLHGLRQIFVTQYVYRTVWRKPWYFFGRIRPYVYKDYIATRAMFPTEYMKSVRQKSRWVLGIAFEEWINNGWGGSLATVYTLLHDRKALFTHFITGIFFICIPFWICYSLYISGNPDYPTLQDQFDKYPWVWHAILFSSFLMFIRVIERMIAVFKIYGILPAIMSAPLILYGNIINLHSLMRAYYQFIFSPKTTVGVAKWDKTDHEFPVQRLLSHYKFKLGDILVNRGDITQEQLLEALAEQNKTGEQVGNLLLRWHYITPKQLITAVADQYGLPLLERSKAIPLAFSKIPGISKFDYDRLINANAIPIGIEEDNLIIAIPDPSHELLLAAIMRWVKPYDAKFVIIEDAAAA